MKVFRIILLAAALTISHSAMAQIRILSKEQIDSIASPPLAPDASEMVFDTELIKDVEMKQTDAPRTFTYTFMNKGKKNLLISRLVSTCSCAKASYDKRIVPPGEKGVITVVYDPEGRLGINLRRVFVYTGDNRQPSAVLRLEVKIVS
ncbi:MAG: DUF1573 domain-containing protein [Bacteroidales bacterium]|nr:DUF1573 domain-containing protein [Bacteroidales bacterium]